jgi:soluble lytic murein transglycosylase-like protein
VDGLSAVQARIAQIQAVVGASGPTPSAATSSPGTTGASWAAAATAAGLDGSGSASGNAVVADAQRYLGVPYRWGGTDPATGLDCSGLTQRVYADLGIRLPRTAAQQATTGTPVASLAQAQPGDLVFFDNSAARSGIDHVGIYVGGGQMIAAPTEGQKVRLQSVGTPTAIRRVLPQSSSTATPATATSSSLAGVPYAQLFTAAGAKYGVSPAVLAAMASQESGFDASAVSAAGARGLMQFMPGTAAGLGVNPLDPASSVDGAARYLADLTGRFGSTELALAAYNAGPGTVSRYGGVPPYAETQNYVRAVESRAEAYA